MSQLDDHKGIIYHRDIFVIPFLLTKVYEMKIFLLLSELLNQ